MKHVSADYAAFMNKCLIFSNYFYPKFNLLELKKKLKNNLQFPFLHCFYSSFLICTCGRFFLYHYYHYYFDDEKVFVRFWLPPTL